MKGLFPSYSGGHIVRRTISFCNKDFSLPVGERAVKFSKCHAMDGRKMNYFIFQLMSINREIVLTL